MLTGYGVWSGLVLAMVALPISPVCWVTLIAMMVALMMVTAVVVIFPMMSMVVIILVVVIIRVIAASVRAAVSSPVTRWIGRSVRLIAPVIAVIAGIRIVTF